MIGSQNDGRKHGRVHNQTCHPRLDCLDIVHDINLCAIIPSTPQASMFQCCLSPACYSLLDRLSLNLPTNARRLLRVSTSLDMQGVPLHQFRTLSSSVKFHILFRQRNAADNPKLLNLCVGNTSNLLLASWKFMYISNIQTRRFRSSSIGIVDRHDRISSC